MLAQAHDISAVARSHLIRNPTAATIALFGHIAKHDCSATLAEASQRA